MAITIDSLLKALVDKDASDLHLKAGQPPVMRVRGDLMRVPELAVSVERHTEMLMGLLNEERRARLDEEKEVDLSYNLAGVSRFRVNMFWQRGHVGAVFRVIPFKLKTIDQLSMPQVCRS